MQQFTSKLLCIRTTKSNDSIIASGLLLHCDLDARASVKKDCIPVAQNYSISSDKLHLADVTELVLSTATGAAAEQVAKTVVGVVYSVSLAVVDDPIGSPRRSAWLCQN